jgi:hypothetical protein
VIERLPDGRFDMDACRLRYLRWLRDPARRSARSEADAEHQRAKTELLKIKIAEKHKTLMLASEHEAFVETLTGLFLTGLAGLAARCGGRDLAVRREIDRAVRQASRLSNGSRRRHARWRPSHTPASLGIRRQRAHTY